MSDELVILKRKKHIYKGKLFKNWNGYYCINIYIKMLFNELHECVNKFINKAKNDFICIMYREMLPIMR